MNIGEAASASGVSAKMIRHYESVELLLLPAPPHRRGLPAIRREGRSHAAVHPAVAGFLGFSIEEIRRLLSLWQDRGRPSRQVKAMAQAHIAELEQKAQEILAMKSTLEHLVHCRKGGMTVRTAPSGKLGRPPPGEHCRRGKTPCQAWFRAAMSIWARSCADSRSGRIG